jgi:uncharacterized protein with HEPN domain
MERDARAFLWDIRKAASDIGSFIAVLDFTGYVQSKVVRSAVERQFEIIGEALSQLSKRAPELAARLPDHRRAIAFRNQLIHGYRRIDHAEVWEIAHVSLPALNAAVTALLDELGPPE